jgi:gliding motility-associated protein GldM
MALPKEPRQKMINLMYLVLTALLALNVSAEILNAFKTVDNSLNRTNTTIANSTNDIMTSFKEQLADEKTRVKAAQWYPKAEQAQRLSAAMYNYIEQLRERIKKEAGYDPAKNGDSTYKEDNQDIATRIMVKEGEGAKLKQELLKYRNAMLALDPKVKEEFEKTLQVDVSMPVVQNKNNKTWEDAYFNMVPTVAAITMLRKFQNDVRTTENRVVGFLHEQVGKVIVRYDAFEAIVGQNSKYLMPGQELEITAGLGAFSKSKLPTVSIGGRPITLNEKGMAVYKTPTNAIGSFKVPVTVAFTDQDGNPQTRTYDVEYTVGQSNAAIALPQMNVMYVGIDNQVLISGGGVGAEKITARITSGNGSISGSGGKFVARVNAGADVVVTAYADNKVLGSSSFRVRNVPRPQAIVGVYESGSRVSKGAFAAQSGVGAGIKDFPLDLKYTVESFELVADDPDGDVIPIQCQGNTFNPRAKAAIQKVPSGGMVTIENIRCRYPDGTVKSLPPLLYTLN